MQPPIRQLGRSIMPSARALARATRHLAGDVRRCRGGRCSCAGVLGQLAIHRGDALAARRRESWEWVEVRNTSATPINLDGWIFDDDDDVPVSVAIGSNIKAAQREHDHPGRRRGGALRGQRSRLHAVAVHQCLGHGHHADSGSKPHVAHRDRRDWAMAEPRRVRRGRSQHRSAAQLRPRRGRRSTTRVAFQRRERSLDRLERHRELHLAVQIG